MIHVIEQHRSQIAALCRKYGIKRLELFGSAASSTSNQAHDLDFFYEFDSGDMTDLADRFFGLQRDLEQLLGLPVDLVSAVDASNPYFLEIANRHRLPLYAA